MLCAFLLSYSPYTGVLDVFRYKLSRKDQNEQIGAIITILEQCIKITLELLEYFHKIKGYFC